MSDAERAGIPAALADDGQACMEACMAQAAGTEGSHEGHWMTPPDADDAASEVPASMGELALQ